MSIQSVGRSTQSTNLSPVAGRTNVETSSEQSASETTPNSKLVKNGKQLEVAELQGMKVSVGEEQLIKAIDRAIRSLEGPSTSFEMKYHEQTKSVIVKVFNKETGELIREIPPEKTLDLVVKMMEFAGILVDEKV